MLSVPWNLNPNMRFPDRCGSRARFAENYPPPAHNPSWRFEMDRIAVQLMCRMRGRANRQSPTPSPPSSCETVNFIASSGRYTGITVHVVTAILERP